MEDMELELDQITDIFDSEYYYTLSEKEQNVVDILKTQGRVRLLFDEEFKDYFIRKA